MGRWGGRDSPYGARDARGISHTFGSKRAAGEQTAKEHAAVPKEEWEKRHAEAKAKHAELDAEGQRRKDSRGAYPKDVQRKMSAQIKEMDLAKQFGGVGKKTESGGSGGGGQHHDPSTGQFT